MNNAASGAADVPAETTKNPSKAASHKVVVGVIAAVVLVAALIYGMRKWTFYKAHEETDDAQVEGHISPVLPRVPGYVTKVLVVDNQHVDAGQALIEIDSGELDLKV